MLHRKLVYFALLPALQFCLFACDSQRSSTEESTYLQDAEAIQKGERLFSRYCASCHAFDQNLIGPNLSGVTKVAGHEWLTSFIRNAPEMIEQGDPRATELFAQYKQYMPAFTSLEDEEVASILAYINTYDEVPVTSAAALDTTHVLENPIPEKIPDSGLRLVLQKVLQAPATAEEGIRARINRLQAIRQNGKERMFLNDLRGPLYEIRNGRCEVFLDAKARFPNFMDSPGLGSGLAQFEFHPEFNENGIFYTTHTEKPGSGEADFTYADSIKVTVQYVLTEWKMDDPQAKTFSGSSREVFRANMVTQIHGMQAIDFRPNAQPGDEDYGLLYIGIGDGGSAFGGFPFVTHNRAGIWGSVLRIDPMGNNSKNGKYGIPANNPWADEPGALGEVYCYGFRNAHHLSWSPDGETLYVTDIGQHQIEEVNIAVPGGDYGWPEREGTFVISTRGKASHVYPLPENESERYIYPVAQYDHDEGNAIVGGGVFQGDIPELQGKYIFGDIVNGRIFFTETDEMQLGQQAPIHSLSIRLQGENETTDFQTLTGVQRVALRIGEDSKHQLYFFTKSDGMLYRVVGCEQTKVAS
ncbi:MAG: PQQ-dependent sugar dehydrogenase [Cyclobacteriaceae bacterium]